MSWQTYVDSNLVGTGCVKYAAICGHDGSIWAKSEAWPLDHGEAQDITKNIGNQSEFASKGVRLAAEKYIFLSGDDSVIRAKKGNDGAHIVKTKQAIIIAVYEKPTVPNQCASVVESLADYLRESDY